MMSWGPKRKAPNEIRNQTERKVGVDITIAIQNLGDLDIVPSPQYNKTETKDHFKKIPNHKRTNDHSPGTPRETDNPSNSEKKTARKCLIAACLTLPTNTDQGMELPDLRQKKIQKMNRFYILRFKILQLS